MGLLDLVTGGKSSDASAAMEQALNDIRAVKTPTADEMKYKIQKLVQAGVITPQQAKTFLQDPNALASMNIDQTGTKAQQEAISSLLEAAQNGGLNPAEEAKMGDIIQQMQTAEKGANDAVLQRAAERGALTGGETIAAQLNNNQNATVNANQNARDLAAESYNNMLAELTSAGSMGQGLQGQQNTQANTVAAATNAINQFNAAQQQAQENFNVGNANQAQAANVENLQNIENQNVANQNAYSQYEAQLPQQVFSDEMQKAGAEAGVGENTAQLDTQQGGQLANLIGGIVGAGGQAAGSYYGAQKKYKGGEVHEYLDGGEVEADNPHEMAHIAGNSPKNDKIPALLSEGEIVLPRTITRNPEPDRVMDFLRRVRGQKPRIEPEDTAHVLKALSMVRNGL